MNDDGSLPDIFVDNISTQDTLKIVSWVETLIAPRPFTVWNIEDKRDETLTSPSKALNLFQRDKIESFRFRAENISIKNHTIPDLGFGIYGVDTLELDYRMGDEWTDTTIIAFLDLLSSMIKIAPTAVIQRCDEGCSPNYDSDFFNALSEFQKV